MTATGRRSGRLRAAVLAHQRGVDDLERRLDEEHTVAEVVRLRGAVRALEDQILADAPDLPDGDDDVALAFADAVRRSRRADARLGLTTDAESASFWRLSEPRFLVRMGGVRRLVAIAVGSLGVVVFLMVAHQMFGTRIEHVLADGDPNDLEAAGVVGRLESIDAAIDAVVRDGDDHPSLRGGVALHPASVHPGQAGHAIVLGHRRAFGADLARLDELEPGDEVVVTTLDGEFTYRIEDVAFLPDRQRLSTQGVGNRLTLVTADPPRRSDDLLLATGVLVGDPVGADTTAYPLRAPTTVDLSEVERTGLRPWFRLAGAWLAVATVVTLAVRRRQLPLQDRSPVVALGLVALAAVAVGAAAAASRVFSPIS